MVSLEHSLSTLVHRLTGKAPAGITSVEGLVQFAAENYDGAGSGVGIASVSGSINKSNQLTLVFTMTNGKKQTVTGTINPVT